MVDEGQVQQHIVPEKKLIKCCSHNLVIVNLVNVPTSLEPLIVELQGDQGDRKVMNCPLSTGAACPFPPVWPHTEMKKTVPDPVIAPCVPKPYLWSAFP